MKAYHNADLISQYISYLHCYVFGVWDTSESSKGQNAPNIGDASQEEWAPKKHHRGIDVWITLNNLYSTRYDISTWMLFLYHKPTITERCWDWMSMIYFFDRVVLIGYQGILPGSRTTGSLGRSSAELRSAPRCHDDRHVQRAAERRAARWRASTGLLGVSGGFHLVGGLEHFLFSHVLGIITSID